jgi:hypothetical protein
LKDTIIVKAGGALAADATATGAVIPGIAA